MSGLDEYRGYLQDPKSLSGVYRGRVEYNKDPLMIGRVRIRVPMLHGSTVNSKNFIQDDQLPWAVPCFMGAGSGFGSFVVPEVGEYVLILFESGDIERPVYIGSCYGTGAKSNKPYGSMDPEYTGNYGGKGQWLSASGINEVPLDAQKADPTRKIIYKSPKGSSFEVEDADAREFICMRDVIGQTVKIESNITVGANVNNSAQRKSGDIETNTKVPANNGSRILIMGTNKQKIEMTSKGSASHITIKSGGITFDLSSDGTDTVTVSLGDTTLVGTDNSYTIKSGTVNVQGSTINLKGNIKMKGKVNIYK